MKILYYKKKKQRRGWGRGSLTVVGGAMFQSIQKKMGVRPGDT